MDAYLTRRGRDAKRHHPHDIVVDYPESGVDRRYCGGNVVAWIDTVALPEDFRTSAENQIAIPATPDQ